MLRDILSIACLCLPAVASAQAEPGAAPRSSSLSWVRMPGAEDCVASRALAEAVEARLGRSVFVSAADAEVAVEGRVERAGEEDASGWRASIVLSSATGELLGERTIDTASADCAELTDPLALVIAVMIDPDAAMRAGEPAEESVEPAEREVVVVERERVVRRDRIVEREGPRWVVEIDAGAGAVFGLIADAAPFVYGGVYVVPPRFVGIELGLGLAYMRVGATGAGDTDFGWGFASLAICPLATGTTLAVAACGGVHLGAVRSEGQDDAGAPADERVTAEVALRFRLSWRPVRWLAVNLRPALLIPIRREPYEWNDFTLYSPWIVTPMVDLGAGVRF